jgi:tRNA A-37 threonylcarbamoyl transferase component Bud32/membrane-associated phospholipid phosphatase
MSKNAPTTYRNPVYIAYALAGGALLILSSAIVSGSSVGNIEIAIFRVFNVMPSFLTAPFLLIAAMGSLFFAILVGFVFLIRKNFNASFKIFLGAGGAYALAVLLKPLEDRLRPEYILDNVNVRETVVGTLGYPSTSVAVATALAIVLYQFIPLKFHKFLGLAVVLVAISMLYLGVNFPADLLAGYAVGLTVGSIVLYALGRRIIWKIPKELIQSQLVRFGFPVKEVEMAKVDARGSAPFFVTDTKDKKYFVKVVGKDNFIADWLFKMTRKIMYRRLEDEAPFLSAKRQIEHESYVAGLAFANGIRTPKIVGVFQVDEQNWGQIQEAIDGKSLDKIDRELITDKVLDQVWRLVADLHCAQIVHRDLRSANIFLAKDGKPWLIDFGFSEASTPKTQTYRDTVELLASLSLLVGPERAVDSAYKVMDRQELEQALPFISYSVLSGATTTTLKSKKGSIDKLRKVLSLKLGEPKVKPIRLSRIYLG